VLNAYRGANLVERHLVEAARTLGAGSVRVMAEVLLPRARRSPPAHNRPRPSA
jgi:ABC-type nitrate/sulfonate/bicarbonate transport system permease component